VTSENAVIETHDISPDGEWIVYQSTLRGNADIYTKRLDGGSPIPITDSPLGEYYPRWSPDGAEIVFFRQDGASLTVMVIPAEGGIPYEVCSGTYGTWSPSGLAIAFESARAGQEVIGIVSRDTVGGTWGEPTQLTDFVCRFADWAPDGSGVLCQTYAGMVPEEMVLVTWEGEVLWRYDPSEAGLDELRHPRFSWDGSTVYGNGIHEDGSEGIWAIPPQGGEPKLVVTYDGVEISGLRFFSVGPENLHVTVGEVESDIWVMDVEVER
jgi:Tol biopolymer transport system component